MKDCDIFICAHKDFDCYPKDNTYKIITDKDKLAKENYSLEIIENTPSKNELFNLSYNEGSHIFYIYNNYAYKKYIGFCHYRRYFDFENEIDLDEIFQKHDIIIPSKLNFNGMNLYDQYGYFHNLDDLNIVLDIISEDFPSTIYNNVMKYMAMPILIPYNIFIMKSKDFGDYCNFVFPILKKFDEIRHFKNKNDINKYVTKHADQYLKPFPPNNTVEYQSRLEGFLLERLTSLYIMMTFKNPLELKIIQK